MKSEIEKWDPFRELDRFQNRLSSLFKHTDGGLLAESMFASGDWSPAVDISEDDEAYHIVADLPDVKKGDMSVKIENGMLVIKGERKREKEEKKKKFHRIERSHGSYLRSFQVPADADSSSIKASSKDGVLEVTLPKVPESKSRTTNVPIE